MESPPNGTPSDRAAAGRNVYVSISSGVSAQVQKRACHGGSGTEKASSKASIRLRKDTSPRDPECTSEPCRPIDHTPSVDGTGGQAPPKFNPHTGKPA